MAHFFGLKQNNSERLTLSKFKDLYEQLTEFNGVGSVDETQLTETLRKISEMIVYGEKDETLFDYFCEKNILAKFVEIVRSDTSNEVKTQVIQTMCIIIQNMKNKTSLYFVLSGNYINQLINYEYDLTDEELLANFISLLKALTLKLNPETVQFFLDPRLRPPPFHLYTRALQFVSSPDPMARTSALNMILHIYQVEDEALRSFLQLEGHQQRFFDALCQSLQAGASRLAHSMEGRATAHQGTLDRLKDEAHGLQDQLYYLEDVMATGETLLATQLRAYFIRHFFYPVLLDGLGACTASSAAEAAPAQVSLFLMAQFFFIVQKAKDCVHLALWALCHPDCHSPQDLDLGVPRDATDTAVSSEKGLSRKMGNPYRAALIHCLTGPWDHLRALAMQVLKAILCSKTATRETLLETKAIPSQYFLKKDAGEEFTTALLSCLGMSNPWPSVETLRMGAAVTRLMLRNSIVDGPGGSRLRNQTNQVLSTTAESMLGKLKGPLGDLFLNLFEDELDNFTKDEAAGCIEVGGVLGSPSLQAPSKTPQMGTTVLADPTELLIPDEEDSKPDEVDGAKKSIQAFLIVHSLHHVLTVGTSPDPEGGGSDLSEEQKSEGVSTAATPVDLDDSTATTPIPLLTPTLRALSKKAPTISTGSSVVLSGRECLACNVPADQMTPQQTMQTGAVGSIVPEQLYLVLDEELLLLATPDRWRLEAGLIRSCAWLHHVDCAVDRTVARKLHLAVRSSSPVGLMWPGLRDHSSKHWHLMLLFENDKNCQIAKQHIEKNRLRLRVQKMRQIANFLKDVGGAVEDDT